MILEKMKTIRDGDKEKLEELRKSSKPILIYGSANRAAVICEFLEQNNLRVEAYIVDDVFWKENVYIKEKRVNRIDDYKDCLEKYNIVIGFCNVAKTRFILDNENLLRTKFYLFWEPAVVYEWDEKYIKDNWNELEIIYQNLGDELSKNVLESLIFSKINKDGTELLKYADEKQYFNELTYCYETQEEVFVDCGAYIGDTIFDYLKFTNYKYKKIYAFEPNKENIKILTKNVEEVSNVQIIEKGTWNKNTTLEFEENGSSSQIVQDFGKTKIHVTTIDEIVGDEKVTFIKMDVEGSEMKSLQGAVNTIKRCMPKLAICCYHKKDDIICLYNYINSISNDEVKYKFYLRHHSNGVCETVMYAIPIKE